MRSTIAASVPSTTTRFGSGKKELPPMRRRSVLQQARHPVGNRIPAAHSGLYQTIDHERWRHVDAVLAGVFAVPFDLAVEIGNGKGLGKAHAAVSFDTGDDVVWRGVHVGAAAMALELEFLPMGSNG